MDVILTTAKSIQKSAEKLIQRSIDVWIAEPKKPLDKVKWDFNDALIAGGIEQVKQDLNRAKCYQKRVITECVDQDCKLKIRILKKRYLLR